MISTPRETFREDASEKYCDQLVESQKREITLLNKIIDDNSSKINEQAFKILTKTKKLRDAKRRIAELEGFNRPQQPLVDELKAKISGLVKEVEKLTKEKAD